MVGVLELMAISTTTIAIIPLTAHLIYNLCSRDMRTAVFQKAALGSDAARWPAYVCSSTYPKSVK